jgi:hypothetical protein
VTVIATPDVEFKELVAYLRRPFMPAAVRWKIQSQWPDGKQADPKFAQVVAYIDARLVIERLNTSPCPDWEDQYEPVQLSASDKTLAIQCNLTVGGVTRSDVGIGQGPQRLKGARSDALKRAAVKFGVGVSVYAIPIVKMQCGAGSAEKLPVKGPDGKRTARIEAAQLEWLAGYYESWLEMPGRGKIFGEPIDHGDVLESAGAEADETSPDAESETLFEDPEPADPKQNGKRINARRAAGIGDLFDQSARDHLELAAKLAELGCPGDVDAADAVKGLKGAQADLLEAWLKDGAE